MTELAIIKDVERCLNGNCVCCAEFKTDRDVCKTTLLRKAKSVLKLQRKENELLCERVKKLTEENEKFTDVAIRGYPLDQVLGKVNNIIQTYYDHDELEEVLRKMAVLLDLVDKGKLYNIAVERDTLRPYYTKRKKKGKLK